MDWNDLLGIAKRPTRTGIHRITLYTANGYGSEASNKVRRFTNYSIDGYTANPLAGGAITVGPLTVFDDAVKGTVITANQDCFLGISYSENGSSSLNTGLILTPIGGAVPATTTAPNSQSGSLQLALGSTPATSICGNCCYTGWLRAGESVRPMTDGANTGTSGSVCMSVSVGMPF